VVLNPKVKGNKSAFKRKGNLKKEYDETVTKKMEEFREMNQGRGGRESGMQIRYGN
jgi:hypothetical protein